MMRRSTFAKASPLPSLLGLWLGNGCYNPDLGPGRFACATADDCPSGQVCSDRRCALSGSGADDAGGAADFAGALPDLGDGIDLTGSARDMSGGPASVDGCARGGYKLTNDVYACVGPFRAKKASDLCSRSYHLCGERPITDGGKVGGVQGCPGAGFFAYSFTSYYGRVVDNNQMRSVVDCSDRNKTLKPAIVGCGGEAGAVIAQADQATCLGVSYPAVLRSALVCESQPANGPWTCQDNLDSAAHDNADPNLGGVLCCRD